MDTGDLLRPSVADASVRPALPADVPSLAAVQARAWRLAYADLLPPQALGSLDADHLAPAWDAAVRTPPTPRHAVLVACAGSTVVGFVAVGPSPDQDAADGDGEVAALVVDPAHQHSGHGSRLLAAAADTLRGNGFGVVRAWVPRADEAGLTFLTSAGMVADGARRGVQGDDGADQVRLAARLDDPAGSAG